MSLKYSHDDFDPQTSWRVKCDDAIHIYSADGTYLLNTNLPDYYVRIFPLQVSLVCVITAVLQVLLKPLGETPVVAQILGSCLVGYSGLSSKLWFTDVVFPGDGGTFLSETLGSFGCMIYIFLVGLKVDLNTVLTSSRKERSIGVLNFVFPLLLNMLVSYLNVWGVDDDNDFNRKSAIVVSIITSTSSFHVITCFLMDLKILNTELGRIASSASIISGMCSWITILVLVSIKENNGSSWLGFILSALAQILFIVLILRKVVIWMIKQTPQGDHVKEAYIVSIFLMIMVTGLLGECCGQHAIFGPMLLGLAIPNGPPIGSTLVDKFDTLTSGLLLPLFFLDIGYKIKVVSVPKEGWQTVTLSCTVGFLGKLMGTFIAGHIYRIPFQDSFMLGLSMSTIGIVDLYYYRTALTQEVILIETYSAIVINSVILAGIIAPIVHFFYDPSRRFIVYKKRCIQNVKPNTELRILVCIYNDDNVPTNVHILEASNATTENPIAIFLLHLVELVGRSNAVFITHNQHAKRYNEPTSSDRVVNGFRICEKKNVGAIFLHPFTSITPLSTAEEDICTLALDKKTSFLIVPFHKQWNIDGTTQTCKWRNVNKKILKHAPCSVGILIDRGVLKGARSVLSNWSTYAIAAIFLGGADDREALCYGMRMIGNKSVYLTVYRIIVPDKMIDDVNERILDENLINEYKYHYTVAKNRLYKEKIVKDGAEIISVIQTMETSYDLVLVGRTHDNHSTLFCGLQEWNEFPELGFFGDMLASSDFRGNASVLVMQQHSCLSRRGMKMEPYNSLAQFDLI